MELCLSDAQIFEFAQTYAVQFVYDYLNFASLIDSNDFIMNFTWVDGSGYCTSDIPASEGQPA